MAFERLVWRYRERHISRMKPGAGNVWDSLKSFVGGVFTSHRRLPPRTAAEILADHRVLLAAHRGASLEAPENTLPAFRRALAHGCDLVELDCRMSADGVWMVLHDATVDRTTNARRLSGGRQIRLEKLTAHEAQRFDAGTWLAARWRGTRIPTLQAACRLIASRSLVLIERKDGPADALVEFLQAGGWMHRVVVQAFDWRFLADCRGLAPELSLVGLGAGDLTEHHLDEAQTLGLVAINWSAALLGPSRVEQVHARGLQCWTWTVDHPAFARELLAQGVDAVITNDPATLKPVLAEAPRRTA